MARISGWIQKSAPSAATYGWGAVRSSVQSNTNNYLSELGAAFQVSQRIASFVKREDTVDHRPELMEAEGAVHRLKHLARSDKDPLYLNLFSEDRHGIHCSFRSA